MNKDYYAVIMAGGVGSRFWPLSKEVLPKQFLDLLGTGQSLLQKTYERLAAIVPEQNIFILTNESYETLVKENLPAISERQIVLEPDMRNTAPCILLSALKIQKENPHASMIVAPSDHWIENEKEFEKDVNTAFKVSAKENIIMTLGIQPDFPHTGYGYIKYDPKDSNKVKKVIKFTEKPDYETAREFLKAGNFLWNAGIFIAGVKNLIEAFQHHLPDMHNLFQKGYSCLNTSEEKAFLKENYSQSENISIDYGIMEKAYNVEVLPVSFDWNDLGSWGSLYDKMAKDEHENVIINTQTYLEDAERNIIRTPKGRVVVIRGLKDFIVVENEEVLMIYPKEVEQEIKETRAKVQEKFGQELG